ncbi:type II secretion system protein [Thalassotalea sp. M1531]|uniref:Type II secretion system protein n=1 Tax=Thalassotalea algicola TaxID=2716224 RepID=A0A7Y0LD19_9GAMM|nr:type II secretion system protein [Thalassotalea algicola]NMP31934.1 type II secretion system protein [Thalassotalea algicola]
MLQINRSTGFTLIELIVGIIVLAISFTVITRLVMPASVQSASQIHQIRAAELGQSLMNEILSKAFDQNSDHVGGIVRCGQTVPVVIPAAPACTAPGLLDNEEGGNREDFNDVDDYHGLNESGVNIENALGDPMGSLYSGYNVSISVFYDSNYDGVNDGAVGLAKLVSITVTTPSDEQVKFATYKVNF